MRSKTINIPVSSWQISFHVSADSNLMLMSLQIWSQCCSSPPLNDSVRAALSENKNNNTRAHILKHDIKSLGGIFNQLCYTDESAPLWISRWISDQRHWTFAGLTVYWCRLMTFSAPNTLEHGWSSAVCFQGTLGTVTSGPTGRTTGATRTRRSRHTDTSVCEPQSKKTLLEHSHKCASSPSGIKHQTTMLALRFSQWKFLLLYNRLDRVDSEGHRGASAAGGTTMK